MSCMKCSSFYSKKPVLSRKIPGCASVTFNITFHPHFHPNIGFFANLPIYRKIIHDNIALCFENQKPFVQYYFEGDIKLFVHINICIRNFGQCYFEEDMYYFQLYWHYDLCQCYFEEHKIYRYSYLFGLLQYSQRIYSNSSKISDYVNTLKLQQLSIIPEQFRMETGSTEVTSI